MRVTASDRVYSCEHTRNRITHTNIIMYAQHQRTCFGVKTLNPMQCMNMLVGLFATVLQKIGRFELNCSARRSKVAKVCRTSYRRVQDSHLRTGALHLHEVAYLETQCFKDCVPSQSLL
jgi:hypothetical protein